MNQQYFSDFEKLDEFQKDSSRGHGVMVMDINNLLIAIPLRSSLFPYMEKAKHLFPYECYIRKSDGKEYLKALDFSKLTLINEDHVKKDVPYIFKDNKEKQFYLDNFNRIQLRVSNYIKTYIRICSDIKEKKTLKPYTLKPYKYSTLRNFHSQLKIDINKEDFKRTLDISDK